MRRFLRRIRGIVGTGITWAIGWGAAFMGLNLFGIGPSPGGGLWEMGLLGAMCGFGAGGSFAVILSVVEGRRRLDQLSLGRVGLWGAVGGMGLFLWLFRDVLFSSDDLIIRLNATYSSFLSLLAAGFSTGSVAIARRADNKLIEGQRESLLSLEEDLEPERIG